jgi:hypothetical protein
MAAVGEAQAFALGNQAIHGCSCRESVAEVGEKHLLRVHRGEPRGEPRRHAVARSGGPSPKTRGGTERFGRKGAKGSSRTVTGTASLFARPQGRESNRWKALWARPGVTSNRVASSGVLAGWVVGVTRRKTGDTGEREGRSLRASTQHATESARGRDVGFGPPSRRAQGVRSQRRRLVPGATWEASGRHVRRAALGDKSRPKLPRRKTVVPERRNGSANCTPFDRDPAAYEDATGCRKRAVEARTGRIDRKRGTPPGLPGEQ